MNLALSLLLLAFCSLFAALPILRRLSPSESAPLKLLLFSALLSPALAAGIHTLLEPALGPASARWGTLLLLASTFLLPQERRPDRVPMGRAAWLAILMALGAALFLAILLFGNEAAIRLGHDGLAWQVGLAEFMLNGGGLEQPWLAGAPLECSPLAGWIVAGLGALTGFGSAWIYAALACWSCALVLLCLHLWSALLWRSGRCDVGVLFLGLFAWGGSYWWQSLPSIGGGWAVALAGVTDGEPGAVLHSGMAWIRGGPGVLAMAYGFGGLYAGAHALRHGSAPWPFLSGLCLALCLGIHPLFGASLVVVHLLTLGIMRVGGVGFAGAGRSLVEFLLPLVPAILLVWRFSARFTPQRVLTPTVDFPALAPGLGLLSLALISAYLALNFGFTGKPQGSPGSVGLDASKLSPRQGRTLVLQLILTALSLVLVGWFGDGVHRDHAFFFRAQGLGLAVLAAGIFGVRDVSWRRTPVLLLPLALAMVMIVSGMRVAHWAHGVHLRLGGVSYGITDSTGHLTLRGSSPRSLALQQIAKMDLAPGTVLALRTHVPNERLPPEPGRSMAGIPAGLALLADSDRGPLQVQRLALLQDVLMGRMHPSAELPSFLKVPGRDVLLVVDDVDRQSAARGPGVQGPGGLDQALLSRGMRQVVDLEGCAVYLWEHK